MQNMPVDIDEETLTEIASMTGGQYFVQDTEGLRQVYNEIDEMGIDQCTECDETTGAVSSMGTGCPGIDFCWNFAVETYLRFEKNP